MLMALPVVTGLSLLRSFAHLAITSILGDICLVLGMSVTMVYGAMYGYSGVECAFG